MKRNSEYYIKQTIKIVFLFLVVLCSLFPIYWTFVNSFRSNTQILSQFKLFPENFAFKNYQTIFHVSTLLSSFFNSALITGSTMLLTGIFSMTAAYVLSSYRFKMASLIYIVFIAGIFIPGSTTMGMSYKLLETFHLLGTRFGIVLLYTSGKLSLSIFLLVAFMRSIPDSVKEAAIIDGCSPLRLFLSIIFPLSRNGLVIVMILTFINVWNEYLWAMILLPSSSKRTLTVALAFFKGEYFTDYGLLSACVIVGLLPVMIVYFLLQNKIINSVAAASVKG